MVVFAPQKSASKLVGIRQNGIGKQQSFLQSPNMVHQSITRTMLALATAGKCN